MIYAESAKRGSFCGFYKLLNPRNSFNYHQFLWQNMLPGPDSHVNCIIRKEGPDYSHHELKLKKDFRVSLVPGLTYRRMVPANLPMPASWERECFNERLQQAIDLKVITDADWEATSSH